MEINRLHSVPLFGLASFCENMNHDYVVCMHVSCSHTANISRVGILITTTPWMITLRSLTLSTEPNTCINKCSHLECLWGRNGLIDAELLAKHRLYSRKIITLFHRTYWSAVKALKGSVCMLDCVRTRRLRTNKKQRAWFWLNKQYLHVLVDRINYIAAWWMKNSLFDEAITFYWKSQLYKELQKLVWSSSSWKKPVLVHLLQQHRLCQVHVFSASTQAKTTTKSLLQCFCFVCVTAHQVIR